MSFDDRLRIETPEGVDLELTLAGLGSRIGGGAIDYAIKVTGVVLVSVLIGVVLSGLRGEIGALGIGILIVVAFLIDFGYDVAFEVLGGGKTLGKRALGTGVLRDTGAP